MGLPLSSDIMLVIDTMIQQLGYLLIYHCQLLLSDTLAMGERQ
jgi:hypothetical protein